MFTKTFDMILIFTFLLSLTFQESLSCSKDYILSSEVVTCKVIKDKKTCQASLNSEITMIGIGDSTCLDFVYENNTVLGLELKYLYEYRIGRLERLYTTQEWELYAKSNRRCDDTGYCSVSKCASVSADDRNPFGQLTDAALQQAPGITACRTVSGAGGIAYTGCASAGDSCLYTRAVLWPVYNAIMYDIYSVADFTPYPIVKASVRGTVNSDILIEGVGDETIISNFAVTLLGSFGEISDTISKKGIAIPVYPPDQVNSPKYHTDYSPKQSPRAGMVGDIQGNSIDDIAYTNYLIDPQIIRINSYGLDGVTYIHDTPGVIIMRNTAKTLPVQNGGDSYDHYSSFSTSKRTFKNVFVGNMKRTGSLKVFIKTKKPLEWSVTVKSVCPILKSVSLKNTSCYDCQAGADLVISAYADCYPGQVKVIIKGNFTVLTNTIYLQKNISFYNITFNSNIPKVISQICLEDQFSRSECLEFKGELKSDVDIRKFNLTDVTSVSPGGGDINFKPSLPIEPESILDSMKKFFNNTWQSWAIAAGVIAGIVLLGVVIFITVKCCFLRMAVNGNLTGAPL